MSGELPLLQVSSELTILVIEADVSAVANAAIDWAAFGLTARVVRGRKMRDYQGLFDEFAAALQFPWYFGENGNAFDECITDLSWLPAGSGYVIVLTDPGEVLSEVDSGLPWLVSTLSRASSEWAAPVDLGEWWDRPPIPFHVVLHSSVGGATEVNDRWRGAGAKTSPFRI